MQFQLLPIVDDIIALYRLPRDADRFKAYMELLNGGMDNQVDKPISQYNPMAKQHVLDKMLALKQLGAEDIMQQALSGLNPQVAHLYTGVFKTCLALADDLQGGWTNRYTTDYDSKFKLVGLTRRPFCTLLLWASETIDEALIRQRTLEYAYRIVYALGNPKTETLAEHMAQEKFVASHAKTTSKLNQQQVAALRKCYIANQHTTEYPVIFNFLYGDDAATQLGYAPLGQNINMGGFEFAAYL